MDCLDGLSTNGCANKVTDTRLEGFNRKFNVSFPGNNNDWNIRMQLAYPLNEFDPIEVWQVNVGHHQIR